MLFLNTSEIRKLDRKIIQTAVEKAYETMIDKDYHMPDRTHVSDGPNSLLLMPCFPENIFQPSWSRFFPTRPNTAGRL
nr:hypothetical protein [Desulfobacula sp.]